VVKEGEEPADDIAGLPHLCSGVVSPAIAHQKEECAGTDPFLMLMPVLILRYSFYKSLLKVRIFSPYPMEQNFWAFKQGNNVRCPESITGLLFSHLSSPLENLVDVAAYG